MSMEEWRKKAEEMGCFDGPKSEKYSELANETTELAGVEVPNLIESIEVENCESPLTRYLYAERLRRENGSE